MATVWPGETRGVWSKQNGWFIYSLPWHMLSAFVNLDQIFSPLNGDCPYTSFGPYSIHLQKLFLYLSSEFLPKRACNFLISCALLYLIKSLSFLFEKGHEKKKHVFALVMGRDCEFHGVRTLQNRIGNTWCYSRLDIHFLLLKVLKNIVFSLNWMMESFKICFNKLNNLNIFIRLLGNVLHC